MVGYTCWAHEKFLKNWKKYKKYKKIFEKKIQWFYLHIYQNEEKEIKNVVASYKNHKMQIVIIIIKHKVHTSSTDLQLKKKDVGNWLTFLWWFHDEFALTFGGGGFSSTMTTSILRVVVVKG